MNLCHHLCVPAPSPHGVKGQCLCRDGYSTTDNGQKCQRKSKLSFYIYDVDFDNGKNHSVYDPADTHWVEKKI